MALALLFSYSVSQVSMCDSVSRISIHFYPLYLWLELRPLLLLSGWISLSLYMYWLGALVMVEWNMSMCRTFRFPKTQVHHIYVIKPKHKILKWPSRSQPENLTMRVSQIQAHCFFSLAQAHRLYWRMVNLVDSLTVTVWCRGIVGTDLITHLLSILSI